MDVRFYPPPTQPPSATDLSCLGPSRRFDSLYCNKFDGENMYMSMSEGIQDFAPASQQLYPVPSLGDEDFNIPPITPPTLPEHMLAHPPESHPGAYHSQYLSISQNGLNGLHHFHPQRMDPPGITISSMLNQDGGLPPSFLSAMLYKANSDSSQSSSHPQMEDFRPSIQSVMMQHGHLSTINQSQLSTHLGLRGNSVHHSSPSPPGSKRASPSPSSSVHEDEAEESLKVGGAEKRLATDVGKKPKAQKKKKRKDPNEPQKPVSAYALFFRDTQAAIKGQNPSATFGEVSKIVASTWDGLGEEQKQQYKRKTEMAKKEYLKQLAAYRASLVSQSVYCEPGDVTSLQLLGSKPAVFPGAGQAQGGVYPALSHPHQQPGVSALLHPGLPRGLAPPPNMPMPMPMPLPGANMAASPPPHHPTMHQRPSLPHQHQPIAMQKPLGNHRQLPLHSQPMPQGFPPQAEFHSMLNGMSAVEQALSPPMDTYIQQGGRNLPPPSVDWSVDYCNNGTLQRERALYLS